MNNSFNKILLYFVAVVLIVNSFWLFFLQKENDALKKQNSSVGNNSASKTGSAIPLDTGLNAGTNIDSNTEQSPQSTFDLIEKTWKNSKNIVGKIKEINKDSLAVDVEIPDLSKMDKQIDYSGKDNKIPITIKTYKILLNDKTEYTDKKLPEMKAGDTCRVYSEENVYDKNEIIAIKVGIVNQPTN